MGILPTMISSDKYLICIVGPTAVGKTEVCLQLAKDLSTEIISADSRQVFKEMSIGTAKPSKSELELVKHHFIDSHSISEDFSAGKFEKECLELLTQLFSEKDIVIMTGGSGLYIDAVTKGLSDIPDVPDGIRIELNKRLQDEGLESMVMELQQVDPEYYALVEKSNPHRVLRGLEVYQTTGAKFSSFRTGEGVKRPFQIIKIGLERNRDELYQRINSRVDVMIDDGLISEVEGLMEFRNKQALQTVGYKEIFDYLDGEISKEKAIELIKRNSRRYAKRQLTWFKRDEDTRWFHPDDKKDIWSYVFSKNDHN